MRVCMCVYYLPIFLKRMLAWIYLLERRASSDSSFVNFTGALGESWGHTPPATATGNFSLLKCKTPGVYMFVCACTRFRWWVGSTYGFARHSALQSICAHVPVTYLKSNKLHWRPGAAAVKYNNIWKPCYLVLARSIEGTLQNAAPTKNIPSISPTINILEEVCVWVPWLSALPTSLLFIFKSTTLKLRPYLILKMGFSSFIRR